LKIANPVISIVVGLVAGGIAIIFTHTNPLTVFKSILIGAFGNTYNFSETLVAAIPLILISAGLLLAFKMKFWNIGAYGQYIMGAMFSSFFALHASQNTSSFMLLAVMCLAGLIGGALWAIISALLKLFWEVNEVVSTLLLNYIALYILYYFMHGPWRDPSSHGFPLSKPFAANAQLPILLNHTRIHLGLVFGIIASLVIYVLIKKTRFGYENKVIGENPVAAKYAGINIFRNTLIAAAISGGLAGLAGMAQVSGIIHMIQLEINAEYGYTAIIVSWLAALNPIASFFVSIILGGLEAGGYQIQMTMNVPFGIVGVIESSILFALLGGELFKTHKLVLRRRELPHQTQ